jgi:hypothetical protein
VPPDCESGVLAGAWAPGVAVAGNNGVAIGSAGTTTRTAGKTAGRLGAGSGGSGSVAKPIAAIRTVQVLAVI